MGFAFKGLLLTQQFTHSQEEEEVTDTLTPHPSLWSWSWIHPTSKNVVQFTYTPCEPLTTLSIITSTASFHFRLSLSSLSVYMKRHFEHICASRPRWRTYLSIFTVLLLQGKVFSNMVMTSSQLYVCVHEYVYLLSYCVSITLHPIILWAHYLLS